MSKYVIKNCPCYVQYENSLYLCCDGQGDGECQDCTDCVMKQIVELCKERTVGFIEEGFIKNDILQLLDTQEIE